MVKMRLLVLLSALMLAAGVALADNDGGSGGDASDACKGADIVLDVGEPATGQLDPPADHVDYYGLEVTEDQVGHTIHVTLDAPDTILLDVLFIDCKGGSVDGNGGKGHQNDSAGHVCAEKGHTAECEDGDDHNVLFVPEDAGIYVIEVRADPSTYNDGAGNDDGDCGPKCDGGGDFEVSGCHDACQALLEYALTSADQTAGTLA